MDAVAIGIVCPFVIGGVPGCSCVVSRLAGVTVITHIEASWSSVSSKVRFISEHSDLLVAMRICACLAVPLVAADLG
jgi:hypothetical protein